MFAALALFSVALLAQDKPAVDRSAEPALKQLFENAGALQDAHYSVQFYNLETGAGRYTLGSSMNVWMGRGGKFRVATSDDMWGGGKTVVSDGTSMLTDWMSDDPLQLSKPIKALHEIEENEPLLYFLEGQPGFDKLVDKDKPVRFATTTGSEKAIEFRAKSFGKLVVYYKAADEFPLPTKIETYRAPWWADPGEDWPDARDREVIRVVQIGKLDPQLFSVQGPKGRKVEDQRTKKSDS